MANIDTVVRVCEALTEEDADKARVIARKEWPFDPIQKPQRRLTQRQLVALWERDGYTDRYTGDYLVYPGALRMLSVLMPDEFPYHPNGKTDECHFIHWEMYPSHDHVIPIARGGADEMDNIVTTSMLHNQIKANWLLDEIGWELKAPGDEQDWDGMKGWFLDQCEKHSQLVANDTAIRRWRSLLST